MIQISSLQIGADRAAVRHATPPAVIYPVDLWPAIPAWKRLFWSRDIWRELRLGGLTAAEIGPLLVVDTRALKSAADGATVGTWVPAELWAAWAAIGWGYVVANRRERPLVVNGAALALVTIDNGNMRGILDSRKFPKGRDPHHIVPGSPAMQHKLKREADMHKAEVAAARARMKRGYGP